MDAFVCIRVGEGFFLFFLFVDALKRHLTTEVGVELPKVPINNTACLLVHAVQDERLFFGRMAFRVLQVFFLSAPVPGVRPRSDVTVLNSGRPRHCRAARRHRRPPLDRPVVSPCQELSSPTSTSRSGYAHLPAAVIGRTWIRDRSSGRGFHPRRRRRRRHHRHRLSSRRRVTRRARRAPPPVRRGVASLGMWSLRVSLNGI